MPIKDYSTYDGCMELAVKIRLFWRAKGYDPHVRVEAYSLQPSSSAGIYKYYRIESDMIGGWPRGEAQS